VQGTKKPAAHPAGRHTGWAWDRLSGTSHGLLHATVNPLAWPLGGRLIIVPDRGASDQLGSGAGGSRTPDLRRAKAALSHLSYGPKRVPPRYSVLATQYYGSGRAWNRTRDLGLIRTAL
jgi:hypothetical protein